MNPQPVSSLKTARPSTLAKLAGILIPAFYLLAATMAGADTYFVTNNATGGSGSLRQAILDSNADDTGGPHRIEFYITTGAQSILLHAPLPAITRSVTIDARTQPGFIGSPLIELNGSTAGASATGLEVADGNVYIYSLVINRFGGDGVRVNELVVPAEDEYQPAVTLFLSGCWIGVNAFGALASPNGGHGVHIARSRAPYVRHTIGSTGSNSGNVISANGGHGIHVAAGVRTHVAIKNNRIGVSASGTTALGNDGSGIHVPSYYEIEYDPRTGYPVATYGAEIGGLELGSGNVISANGEDGIHVFNDGALHPMPIHRNLIGTDANGTVPRGNSRYGIFLDTLSSATVGSSTSGNIIAASGFSGIRCQGSRVAISGNSIGTNNIGSELGNGIHGVQLVNVPISSISGCTIGNNSQRGVSIEGTCGQWSLIGNRIGTNATGSDIGNGTDGVYAAAFDTGSNYGSFGSGGYMGPGSESPANKVAFNGGAGVRVLSPTVFFDIISNEFWNNGGLAIDLAGNGLSPNDSGDGDTGPNRLQNFPVITLATPVRVAGTLDSEPNLGYLIEVYAAAPDGSGHGEGQTYLGSQVVGTDNTGKANFSVSGLSLAPGSKVTAIATARYTDGNGWYLVMPRTSEFAQNATVISQDTGDFRMASATAEVGENQGSVMLTVERFGASYGAATISYATASGTAASGADFSAQTGTLSFASGQTSRTITIPINNDSSDETNESFTVTLSNPVGGPVIAGQANTTVTILDDDNPPIISIDNRFIKEGNAGTTPMVFTVSLSAPSVFPVSVNWVTIDQTATNIIDYSGGGNGIINFSPGETQKTITLNLIGDLTQETNESFQVLLQSPSNGTLGTATGTGTILDDDSPGAIQFGTSSYSIAEASETGLAIFVSRNGGGGPVTVNYAVTGGTATPGDDYSTFNMSGTLSFGSGETVKQITVSSSDDILVEGNETIILSLSNPTGGATLGGASTTTVTITDDDTACTLQGRVYFDNGSPLAGITVNLGGSANASVTTDSNGFYLFQNLPVGGSYTVTPASDGYVFTPGSRSFPNLTNTLLDQHFTVALGVPPSLYIANNGNGTITLTWPAPSTGWMLQRSISMAPDSWQLVIIPPQTIGEWKSLVLPISEEKEFFRLKRP